MQYVEQRPGEKQLRQCVFAFELHDQERLYYRRTCSVPATRRNRAAPMPAPVRYRVRTPESTSYCPQALARYRATRPGLHAPGLASARCRHGRRKASAARKAASGPSASGRPACGQRACGRPVSGRRAFGCPIHVAQELVGLRNRPWTASTDPSPDRRQCL